MTKPKIFGRLHSKVYGMYTKQRISAAKRGIEFFITFTEWCSVWKDSGKFNERGKGSEQYCMARHNDTGPYTVDNVSIVRVSKNGADGGRLGKGRPSKRRGRVFNDTHRLTVSDIEDIKLMFNMGTNRTRIAKAYGVAWSTINKALRTKNYGKTQP